MLRIRKMMCLLFVGILFLLSTFLCAGCGEDQMCHSETGAATNANSSDNHTGNNLMEQIISFGSTIC